MHGIDLSAPMIEQLLAKPGADQIGTTIGDSATTRVDGTLDVVSIVRNSITNLTTQDEQVECSCNAAAHLRGGGYLVVDVTVPQLQRLPPGERVRPFLVSPEHLGFLRVRRRQSRPDLPALHRDGRSGGPPPPRRSGYVWPVELDLMARIGA